MKARIKPAHVMTNVQKAAADQYVIQQQEGVTRRLFKLMIIALNNQYGFGKVRSARLMHEITELAECQKNDEIFWAHVDMRCHQIGFDFVDEDWREGFS